MPDNKKVHFGLRRLYVAEQTITTTGAVSYGTPIAVPGAVAITLAAQGEMTRFYADNVEYFTADSNQGYTGDLQVARFPDAVRTMLWGDTLTTTSKVLIEKTEATAKAFALLWQFETDVGDELHVLYNCTASRPGKTGNTTGETVEVATETSTIRSSPLPDGRIHVQTTDDTPQTTTAAWFTSVFVATT